MELAEFDVGDVLVIDDGDYLVQSIYYHGPDPMHVDVFDLQRGLDLMFFYNDMKHWHISVLPREQAGLGRPR